MCIFLILSIIGIDGESHPFCTTLDLQLRFYRPMCYNSRAYCPLLQCLRTRSAIIAGEHSYFVGSFKWEGNSSCHDLNPKPHIYILQYPFYNTYRGVRVDFSMNQTQEHRHSRKASPHLVSRTQVPPPYTTQGNSRSKDTKLCTCIWNNSPLGENPAAKLAMRPDLFYTFCTVLIIKLCG